MDTVTWLWRRVTLYLATLWLALRGYELYGPDEW